MGKCIICGWRPAGDNHFCNNCNQKVQSEKQKKNGKQPVKFLTYRGSVVGLYPNGAGRLTPRLLKRSPEHLPKTKTLDLNTYIDGFTREDIKGFKRCVLQLANA